MKKPSGDKSYYSDSQSSLTSQNGRMKSYHYQLSFIK